jgi:hypothetical protein
MYLYQSLNLTMTSGKKIGKNTLTSLKLPSLMEFHLNSFKHSMKETAKKRREYMMNLETQFLIQKETQYMNMVM